MDQLSRSVTRSASSPSVTSRSGPTRPTSEVVHPVTRVPFKHHNPLFLNDANCYRRLARELGRFVASTMSPNNPQQHVPTDEELQHHARWILYDDDDPWNQTAADNAEWLLRFKRDCGIIQEGPGLPIGNAWSTKQGGTGFAPPYAFPSDSMAPVTEKIEFSLSTGAKTWEAEPEVANKFFESLATRYDKPATIFCSRELEAGLSEFVRKGVASQGIMPSDKSLRDKAREILGDDSTAADDPVLLEKFKRWMRQTLGILGHPTPGHSPLSLPTDVNMSISDEEMNTILQDIHFEFDPTDMADLGMNMDVGPTGSLG